MHVDEQVVGEIGLGLLVLLGIERGDSSTTADKLLHKVTRYRVFSDPAGHMNLDVNSVGGSLLVVSQFTLAADTHKGLRPSFSSAMPPDEAKGLFDYFVRAATDVLPVETGRFGADMQVHLTNDGPVTFLLSA